MSEKCTAVGCEGFAIAKGFCRKHYVRMRRTGKLTTTRNAAPFWEKVAIGSPTECWPWTGYTKDSGHGLTTYRGMPIHASRKAWILANGFISGALCVNHKCDNALCCNPAHMYLGTRQDNMVDHWGKVPAHERGGSLPHNLAPNQVRYILALRRHGKTLKETSELSGHSLGTIMRVVTENRRRKIELSRAARMSNATARRV